MSTTANLGLDLIPTSAKDKVAMINTNMERLDDILPKPPVVASSDPATLDLPPGSVYYNSATKRLKLFIDGEWKALGPPYLGDLAADPTTGFLPEGTRYYNTTSSVFRTFRGPSWVNG